MMLSGGGDSLRFKGVVVPAAWDDQGKVTAVALSTFDEQEYMVEGGFAGSDLLGLIRREVEILGRLGTVGEGGQCLLVEEIRVKPRRAAGQGSG